MTTNLSTEIRPGTYTIDRARSTCHVLATHAFGLKPVTASVEIRSGTVTVGVDPRESNASAELDAASFRSDDPRRDRNVRGFLDASRHPVIAFRSTGCTPLSPRGEDIGHLQGLLRLRSRESQVELLLTRVEPVPGGYRWTARCTLDRVRAGVTAARGLIARRVHITLDVVATV
jgi:polyisoprenoid-binding protein YceI